MSALTAAPVREQESYARVAGLLLLLVMATAIAGEVVPAAIRGDGDLTERAARVLSQDAWYRLARVSTAIMALGVLVLAHALYVVLEPVDRQLAQLALWARLAEASLIGAALAGRFAALELYEAAAASPSSFDAAQLEVLISQSGLAYESALHVWLLFWALGSALFFWLFLRSGYIPRPLALLGVGASAIGLIVSLGSLVVPEYGATLQLGWAVSFAAEVGTGLWLLLRGIRVNPKGD